jgi:hypothetical protein
MPSTFAGGVKRLIFTGYVKTNLDNKYVGGAGVGAHSTSSRRALKRRATSSRGRLGPNNTLIEWSNRCCNSEIAKKTNEQLYQQTLEPSYNISDTLMLQVTTDLAHQSARQNTQQVPPWHPWYQFIYYNNYNVAFASLSTPEYQAEIREQIIQQYPDPNDSIYST